MNKKILIIIPTAIIISLTLAAFIFHPVPGSSYTKTELYFGLSIPGGGNVSNEEWSSFADSVITPVFLYGSTAIESKGEWLGSDKKITKEESKLVISINEMTDELTAKIDTIRAKYKRYYRQESVMRVDYPVNVNF